MNLASHSSFDKYVLLQFKSGLREQQRELHRGSNLLRLPNAKLVRPPD
jgi:hypothetical protein